MDVKNVIGAKSGVIRMQPGGCENIAGGCRVVTDGCMNIAGDMA